MGLLKFALKATAIKSAENVALKFLENKANEDKKENFDNPGVAYCRLPTSLISYVGLDVNDVLGELEAYGFSNIVLQEKKKSFLNKEGTVHKVLINGKDHFEENDKIPQKSRIVVEYYVTSKK